MIARKLLSRNGCAVRTEPTTAAAVLLCLLLAGCASGTGTDVDAGESNTAGASWNRPDLSGTYDTATITPLQRPEKYGDKLVLSAAEAKAIDAAEAARRAEANADSDPNRQAPPEGGDGNERLGAGSVGGYNLFWVDPGEETTAVDGEYRTSVITSPANGRIPDMTPGGLKRLLARRALYRPNTGTAWWLDVDDIPHGPYDGPETLALSERCILGFGSTAGPPMLSVLYNNHKRIVQADDHVLIQVEMIHEARIVRMNAAHRPATFRTWLGDSVGRWEGDTLVVDTTNFTDRPALYGADQNLHIVERFSRVDDDTLLYQFTVADPTIWQEPWSGEYTWKATDEKVYEYACHEGNYSMENVLKGARLLEQEAMGAKVVGSE
ncbi:MAG: hypothetical protein AB8B93_12765 [Pseudomonadales bacterium]